jgi:hypothetical protein
MCGYERPAAPFFFRAAKLGCQTRRNPKRTELGHAGSNCEHHGWLTSMSRSGNPATTPGCKAPSKIKNEVLGRSVPFDHAIPCEILLNGRWFYYLASVRQSPEQFGFRDLNGKDTS